MLLWGRLNLQFKICQPHPFIDKHSCLKVTLELFYLIFVVSVAFLPRPKSAFLSTIGAKSKMSYSPNILLKVGLSWD